jgi:opacity protein-like surface antigen
MKKILTLLLIISMMTLAACRAEADINDPGLQGDNTVGQAGTGQEGVGQNEGFQQGGDQTQLNDAEIAQDDGNDYVTGVQGIEQRLRQNLGELDAMDAQDIGFGERASMYSNRAGAYQAAMDDLDRLDFGNQTQYYDDIRGYYEHGYTHYNDLASRYGGFQTPQEELRYLEQFGETGPQLNQEFEQRYNTALRGIGVN